MKLLVLYLIFTNAGQGYLIDVATNNFFLFIDGSNRISVKTVLIYLLYCDLGLTFTSLLFQYDPIENGIYRALNLLGFIRRVFG